MKIARDSMKSVEASIHSIGLSIGTCGANRASALTAVRSNYQDGRRWPWFSRAIPRHSMRASAQSAATLKDLLSAWGVPPFVMAARVYHSGEGTLSLFTASLRPHLYDQSFMNLT